MATENGINRLAAMIVDLQKFRAAIDSAIGSLTTALSMSGAMIPTDESSLTTFTSGGGLETQSTELPRGAFLNKSLPAAVKLYLTAVKKKQTAREIANALHDGGIESTSDNFEGVVTGCLHRMKASGELLRFKDGWSLAEFYPESLRSRLSQEAAPKKKSSKAKKARKASKPTVSKDAVLPPGHGLEHRIEEFVKSRQGGWFTSADVVQALPDAEHKSIPLALGRLAKKHKWEKSEGGKYRIVSGKLQEMPKAI